MKQIAILILGLVFMVGCAEDKDTKNNIFDPFHSNDKVASQFFDLDTIEMKEIIGERGTKIYFHRNAFDVDSTDKISMELKEFYGISDLIKNNIRTLTKDNELLESSGVIYLNFTKNGEELKLKDSLAINVRFPVNFSSQDKIFNGDKDSLGLISWSESDAYFSVMRYDKEYQIDMQVDVTLDSLPYYQELWRKQDSIYQAKYGKYDKIKKSIGSLITLKSLGWVNIDKYVSNPTKMDFEISNQQDIDAVIFYFVYQGFNSFTSFIPNDKSSIKLKGVPIIENTSLIAVGIKDQQLLAQKIMIEDSGLFDLALKPISQAMLKELFENN